MARAVVGSANDALYVSTSSRSLQCLHPVDNGEGIITSSCEDYSFLRYRSEQSEQFEEEKGLGLV